MAPNDKTEDDVTELDVSSQPDGTGASLNDDLSDNEETVASNEGVSAGVGGIALPGDSAEVKKTKKKFPEIPDVEISGQLGKGGMGVVYSGKQEFLDRRVAVKVLPIDQNPDVLEALIARFKREAKLLAGLQHQHIVTCYQAGVSPDQSFFLVMELIDGPTLKEWISENGPLDDFSALKVVGDVAEALNYALKQGIVHRDVKPANVLLKPLEDAPHDEKFPFEVKLADLGLAKYQFQQNLEEQLTAKGTAVGTPSVMAPELFDKPDDTDHRTDIYSLGCILYECLTGKPAYRQKTLSEMMARKLTEPPPDPRSNDPKITPALARLATDLMARQPDDRPGDYSSIIEQCRTISLSYSQPIPQQAVEAAKKGSRFPLVLGVIIIVALSVGAWVTMRDSPAPTLLDSEAVSDALETQESTDELPAQDPASTTQPAAYAENIDQVSEPVDDLEQPAYEFTLDPENISFDEEAKSLFSDDFLNRVKDWSVVKKGSSWGSNLDYDEGVDGTGSGAISREIDAGEAWRLSGYFTVIEGEMKVCLLGETEGFAVGVQRFEPGFYLSVNRLADKDGEFHEVELIGAHTVDSPEGVEIIVELKAEEIHFFANGEPVQFKIDEVLYESLVQSEPKDKVTLEISKSKVVIQRLTLQHGS